MMCTALLHYMYLYCSSLTRKLTIDACLYDVLKRNHFNAVKGLT